MQSSFHLSLPIKNLKDTIAFYRDVLGCKVGRNTPQWADIDIYGHQVTFVLQPNAVKTDQYYSVGKVRTPVFHFGVVLPKKQWNELKDKIIQLKHPFFIEPETLFEGQPFEQQSFMLKGPNGYAVEFKTFENPEKMFSA